MAPPTVSGVREQWSPLTYPCPACGRQIDGTDTTNKRTPWMRVAWYDGQWMHRDCALGRRAAR
jgi:hypothetical protein